jgi:hypothetical protein
MKVWEFEQAVYEREEVRLVIRAAAGEDVGDYGYVKCSPATTSVSEWLRQRIHPTVGDYEVIVIDGNGAVPHGRTRMATLRETYER